MINLEDLENQEFLCWHESEMKRLASTPVPRDEAVENLKAWREFYEHKLRSATSPRDKAHAMTPLRVIGLFLVQLEAEEIETTNASFLHTYVYLQKSPSLKVGRP